MMYGLIGRIVVWVGRRYARRRYGNRPTQVTVGLLVAGAIAAVLAAGRRQ